MHYFPLMQIRTGEKKMRLGDSFTHSFNDVCFVSTKSASMIYSLT